MQSNELCTIKYVATLIMNEEVKVSYSQQYLTKYYV